MCLQHEILLHLEQGKKLLAQAFQYNRGKASRVCVSAEWKNGLILEPLPTIPHGLDSSSLCPSLQAHIHRINIHVYGGRDEALFLTAFICCYICIEAILSTGSRSVQCELLMLYNCTQGEHKTMTKYTQMTYKQMMEINYTIKKDNFPFPK